MPDRYEELHRLLRGVNRGVFHLARDMLHGHGLPPHSMAVMRLIFHNPGITVSELSRETGMAKSYTSKTIESLAAAGILEKRKDPADQRVLRIHPTEAARAHYREVHAAIEARLAAIIATLPTEKVDALIDGLHMLQGALDKVAEAPTQ
jgi:DNA-binding MarR family transcriptional regulator